MAYDEKLAGRVRDLLSRRKGFTEKKMFGGIAFLLDGRMCCGVLNGDLVARIGREDYADALGKPHVRPMDFTGRPLSGFVYVGPEAVRTAGRLRAWLEASARFVGTQPRKTKQLKKRRASRAT